MNKYEQYLMANPTKFPQPTPQPGVWSLAEAVRQYYSTVLSPLGTQLSDTASVYTYDIRRSEWVSARQEPTRNRAEHRQEERIRTNHCDFREFLGYGQGQRRRS